MFLTLSGQLCGFAVEYPDEDNDALGQLTVFFDEDVSQDVKHFFLRYVNQQLKKLALEGSVKHERIYACPTCKRQIPQEYVHARMEMGETTAVCPVDLTHVPIDNLIQEMETADERVAQSEAVSNEERERHERLIVIERRERAGEFHTFLSYNTKDKALVLKLRDILRDWGIAAWIDVEEFLGGDQVVSVLEEIIDRVPSALLLVGPNWIGQWQRQEYYELLRNSVEDRKEERDPLRLIPVLLPGAPSRKLRLPALLRGRSYIDLRSGMENRDEIRRLVQSILSEGRAF